VLILAFDAQSLLCKCRVLPELQCNRRGVFQFVAMQVATGRTLLHQAKLQAEGL
jgi:predicted DCC family thiol-disulfide oxidoreductase YuxK